MKELSIMTLKSFLHSNLYIYLAPVYLGLVLAVMCLLEFYALFIVKSRNRPTYSRFGMVLRIENNVNYCIEDEKNGGHGLELLLSSSAPSGNTSPLKCFFNQS